MRKKLSVLISTAMIPIAPIPVLAQSAGASLEEIVVTAQRRETNLQSTPISIQAFSAEDLDLGGIWVFWLASGDNSYWSVHSPKEMRCGGAIDLF